MRRLQWSCRPSGLCRECWAKLMRICQQPVIVISICCNTFVPLAEMVKHRRAFLLLGMFLAVSVYFYVRLWEMHQRCVTPLLDLVWWSRMQMQVPANVRWNGTKVEIYSSHANFKFQSLTVFSHAKFRLGSALHWKHSQNYLNCTWCLYAEYMKCTI